jgi:excisionase family DNA binding protein
VHLVCPIFERSDGVVAVGVCADSMELVPSDSVGVPALVSRFREGLLLAFVNGPAENLRGRFAVLAVSRYMNANRSTTKPSAVHLDDPLLRPDEAARLLAVKTNWIYEAVRRGRLPCLRLGRHIRFTRAMLEQWLEEIAGS